MAEEIIDLTKSEDDVVITEQPDATDKERAGTRRGARRGNRHSKNQTQNAAREAKFRGWPQSPEPPHKSTQSDRDVVDKERDGKAKPDPPKSNRTSGSLLSRIGDILHENDKANSRSASGKSKRGSRDRPPAETMAKEGTQAEPRTNPLRSSKEVPLSELPVDQLFFIDTGPSETNRGASLETSPPGTTGSATPDVGPGAASSSAKTLKKKLAKERKKEQKQQAEGKVPGDTLNEIEFIGGSALVVDQTIAATVTRSEGQVVAETVSVTTAPDTTSETTGLSLPAHVTIWAEGDPEFPLESATEALDLEDVEFLDYEGDQATGIPRYFVSELATATKKACRTCGEEGHIAKFCKKLICLTCGERDDHDTRNCPMRVVCFNCGGKGHLSSTCPQPRGRPGCDRCGSSKHIEQRCPEQFKTYVYLSEAERLQVLEEREALENIPFGEGGEGYIARHKWCYNCGNGGHWGDDCKDTRPFSMPTEPCAFGSFNESRGPFGECDDTLHESKDAPRPAWMDDDPHLQDVGRRGKEANMRRNRAAEARHLQERDEDDWFSRTAAGSSRNRPSNDRGSSSKDAPPKPKFSFKPRDDHYGSNRRASGDQDVARDRNRERRRDNERDYDRRKRGREYEDEGNHRRRNYDGDSRRRYDPRDRRDDDRRKRSGDKRDDGDRYGPQYRVPGRSLIFADWPPSAFKDVHHEARVLHLPAFPPRMDAEKAQMSEKFSDVSVNVEFAHEDEGQNEHTKRVLNARQVQLFSIGGTIGTSIFVAIGTALVRGGPLSLLLGYAFWCSVIFCVNEGQAEMVCLLPIESSFNRFAARWVDRAFGAATSWNYWICMAALLNFEVTAFTAVIGFWTDDVHPVVFPIAMLAAYAILNLWSAKFFGETEFWISLMKVILIVGLLIMTFFLMVGVNPQRDAFGFRYWRDPGPMAEYISTGDLGRFQGLFACVLSAGFAVAGPDILSIIAGEAKAPRRIMPKAFRTVFIRLILFFVLGSLAVGILVPYNDRILNAAITDGKPGAARSPYVAALTRLNVPVLPHIINAMILTSIFSAGNAFLFNGSRTLHGIALDGFAPSFIRKTNRNGVPWIAVTITLIVGCLSFLQVNEDASKVLDWFINVATSAQLVTWIAMCVTWIRWDAAMKAQGISRDILPYRSRFQPYGAWYGLIISVLVTFFNGYYVFLKGGWATADFIFAYGSVFIFLAVYAFVKVFCHSPFIRSEEADLFSGKKEIDDYEAKLQHEPPSTRIQRIMRWLF